MSSDSSDDEELDKLREAADPQFINNSMFSDKKPKDVKKDLAIPPSLRHSKDDDEQFNMFRVSPEFRNYVAKHLSTILDGVLEKKISYKESNYDNLIKPKRRKGGIKLFKTSSHYLKLHEKQSTPLLKTHVEENAISEDELKVIAVNPEDILNQKETKHWSTRSKAPVFTYIKTKQGLVLK